MRILIVEDDGEVAEYIRHALGADGHSADHVENGHDGLSLAMSGAYDAAIVDRMLPGLDGVSLVKRLREQRSPLPVLFLTNLGGIDDRVEGLESGGDDYLVKPFALSELLARVNALLRRPATLSQTTLRAAGIDMDLLKRTVTRDGRPIDLQPREFKLLECLMRHAGRVVTRTMLLEMVWDFHFDPKTNIVETHISRLRAKLGSGSDLELIQTVRGSGYVIRAVK
jgi:two-component system OmpR family response regulator